VLVRKIPSDKPFIDMRVCVLGNVDCGKSSLVGVLTTRQLDSGRGRARLNLLRHPHEIQTGHTSSVCHEILGFDSHGQAVDYSVVRNKEEICELSSKLITFIDLPGGQKSLKTTIFGLTGYYPDYALILVAASQGIVDTTREHFALALALNIPCAILVTKADLLHSCALDLLLNQIKNVLEFPGVGKMCVFVRDREDAVKAASPNFRPAQVVPVFTTSSVNGQGMDVLKVFLNVFPLRNNLAEEEQQSSPSVSVVSSSPSRSASTSPGGSSDRQLPQDSFCGLFGPEDGPPHQVEDQVEEVVDHEPDADFKIDETFTVPNVGCVVGGILQKGIIRRGDEMYLGPYEDGSFRVVKVVSLHRSGRAPCSIVRQNQTAAIAIKPNYPVRKGMVLLATFHSADEPENVSMRKQIQRESFTSGGVTSRLADASPVPQFKASMELEAEILILFHPTRIHQGFQCTLHIDNIVQSALIKTISLSNGNPLVKRNKTQSLANEEAVFDSDEAFEVHPSSLPSATQIAKPPTSSRNRTASGPSLCTNEKGHVTFRFLRHCEYVRPGMRILLRHGKTKGIGNITKVYPYVAGEEACEETRVEDD